MRKTVVTVQDGSLNLTQLSPIQIKTFPLHLHFHFLQLTLFRPLLQYLCAFTIWKLIVHPLLQPTALSFPIVTIFLTFNVINTFFECYFSAAFSPIGISQQTAPLSCLVFINMKSNVPVIITSHIPCMSLSNVIPTPSVFTYFLSSFHTLSFLCSSYLGYHYFG